MTRKQRVEIIGTVMCVNCLQLACILYPAPARASHSHYEENFDHGSGFWFPNITRPDATGGRVLGPIPNGSLASVAMLDALPALNTTTGQVDSASRRVSLSFDFVAIELSSLFGDLSVTANGATILQLRPVDYLPSGGGLGHVPLVAQYTLHVSPFFESTDLVLGFRSNSSLKWGLDNVVLDWGQPVPEPTAAILGLTGAIGLGAYWYRLRGRRKLAKGYALKSKPSALPPTP